MSNSEIKPLTKEAETLLGEVYRKKFFAKCSDLKLLCACLGPNKENKLFEYRQTCLDIIKEEKHIAFFPESITPDFISKLLDKEKLPQTKKDAISNDKNLLNEFIVMESDLIFVIPVSIGPATEFIKYTQYAPGKVKVLVPKNEIHDGVQTGMDIKAFQEEYPNSVIEVEDQNDVKNKVKKYLEIETRIKMRGGIFNEKQ